MRKPGLANVFPPFATGRNLLANRMRSIVVDDGTRDATASIARHQVRVTFYLVDANTSDL